MFDVLCMDVNYHIKYVFVHVCILACFCSSLNMGCVNIVLCLKKKKHWKHKRLCVDFITGNELGLMQTQREDEWSRMKFPLIILEYFTHIMDFSVNEEDKSQQQTDSRHNEMILCFVGLFSFITLELIMIVVVFYWCASSFSSHCNNFNNKNIIINYHSISRQHFLTELEYESSLT